MVNVVVSILRSHINYSLIPLIGLNVVAWICSILMKGTLQCYIFIEDLRRLNSKKNRNTVVVNEDEANVDSPDVARNRELLYHSPTLRNQ